MAQRRIVCAGVAAVLAALSTRSVSAQVVNVTTDPSHQSSVGSVAPYTTFFDQLDGMTVGWTLSDGSSHSGVWGQLSSNIWGVTGTDFSLKAIGSDDTYGLIFPYQWSLKAAGLTSFSLDATPANFVFDMVNSPDEGTPGSNVGRQYGYCNAVFLIFCYNTDDNWGTTATYVNEVAVGPNAPVGDLWGGLDVTFDKTFGNLCKPTRNGGCKVVYDDVLFSQDVDAISDPGPGFLEGGNVTPEPATMSLLAMGLVGIGGAGLRRRKRVSA